MCNGGESRPGRDTIAMTDSRSSHRSTPPTASRGSSRRAGSDVVLARSVAEIAPEDQKTVISTRTPADFADSRPLNPAELGKILEGEQLGQFVLQQFVGGGGMGAVFRALDTTLNREVAVKV